MIPLSRSADAGNDPQIDESLWHGSVGFLALTKQTFGNRRDHESSASSPSSVL